MTSNKIADEKINGKNRNNNFSYSSPLRPIFPGLLLFALLFKCNSLLTINPASISAGDKSCNTLVTCHIIMCIGSAFVGFMLDLFERETRDKQSKYWFSQFVNQSPFNILNGKQQLFKFIGTRWEREKEGERKSNVILIRLRSYKIHFFQSFAQ